MATNKGYWYIFKFRTPSGYTESFDFYWHDYPLDEFVIRSFAYAEFRAECPYFAFLIPQEDFVKGLTKSGPVFPKTRLDGAEFEGVVAPYEEGEWPPDIPAYAVPGGCREFKEVEDLPGNVQSKLRRKLQLHRRDITSNSELDELVYRVETRLWDITHKNITTRHADVCMRAQPEMIIALERWVDGAIRKWEEKVRAGVKPKKGPHYVEGKLWVTSCYRRLGTTCEWDTHGCADAGDPTGHWAGFAIDVTNVGFRNYFGNTFDPPLTIKEINDAAESARLVQDIEYTDPETGEPALETWHWRLPGARIPSIK
jgi:hypothetical protein